MISCTNLSYKINNKTILKNINFSLKPKENLLIIGPSGSGKTSLLCLLAGLAMPNSGSVLYNKIDIHKLKKSERDKFRGKNLGIIFQNFHLIKSLNLYQNIALSNYIAGTKTDHNQIMGYLRLLGLEDKAEEKISTLSIGQSQRLAIIRSFINKPKWILCDEPSSALDDANTNKLLELLKTESKKNQSSLIIITHDKRVKSYFKNDKILEL